MILAYDITSRPWWVVLLGVIALLIWVFWPKNVDRDPE